MATSTEQEVYVGGGEDYYEGIDDLNYEEQREEDGEDEDDLDDRPTKRIALDPSAALPTTTASQVHTPNSTLEDPATTPTITESGDYESDLHDSTGAVSGLSSSPSPSPQFPFLPTTSGSPPNKLPFAVEQALQQLLAQAQTVQVCKT